MSSPSNSAWPTPTMMIDMGSLAACHEQKNKQSAVGQGRGNLSEISMNSRVTIGPWKGYVYNYWCVSQGVCFPILFLVSHSAIPLLILEHSSPEKPQMGAIMDKIKLEKHYQCTVWRQFSDCISRHIILQKFELSGECEKYITPPKGPSIVCHGSLLHCWMPT